MTDLPGIINQRTAPGILVIDLEDRVVFSNERAMELLSTLGPAELRSGEPPEEVRQLCAQARQNGGEAASLLHFPGPPSSGQAWTLLPPCSLRAFPLGVPGAEGPITHTMVLLERIVEKRVIDIERARATFQLSKREAEVLNLLGLGYPNKKIAEALFVSEHTVKDHIKNLMKKLGASSRGEVVASLR